MCLDHKFVVMEENVKELHTEKNLPNNKEKREQIKRFDSLATLLWKCSLDLNHIFAGCVKPPQTGIMM